MAKMSLSVTGAKEMRQKIEALSKDIPEVAERSAVAAGNVFSKGMKRRIKKRSGRTAGTIGIRDINRTRGGLKVTVGPFRYSEIGKLSRAYIARFLEYGHDIVVVTGKRRSAGHGKRYGRMVNATKVVGHVPAYPFIRPTLDEDKDIAMREARAEVEKAIARVKR